MTVTTDDTLPDPGAHQRPPVPTRRRARSTEPCRLVEEDLLVEDVSIDGMCGVY